MWLRLIIPQHRTRGTDFSKIQNVALVKVLNYMRIMEEWHVAC